jgi:hypothetical protein
MSAKANDDAGGCVLLILIAFLAMGIGSLWGAAYGFLSVALAMFILLVLAA